MRQASKGIVIKAAIALICIGLFSNICRAEPEVNMSNGQTVYVPVYSHVYHGNQSRTLNLAITLAVRNADPTRSISVLSVNYHDSRGKLVRSYLERTVELRPLESVYYIVDESDVSGGDAPSFLVRWKSDQKVSPPVIEGIMIGTVSAQGISFVTSGRAVDDQRVPPAERR